MKKLLAMVLALVMTLSLAVSASAFKDDKDINDTYAEAVAVLNGMGVFKGYEDGSFQPKGDITRAEVAALVYRVYTTDVTDAKASLYATYNKFSDMAGAGWAAGYIGYCANAELVKGYPDGTFKPSGKVTGYEVLAMILRAIGYDKNNEFTGADWSIHVAQTAQQAGVLENIKGVDLNAAATRELVAEMLFRTLVNANQVTYTAAFGYQTVSLGGDKLIKDNATLGAQNFELEKGTSNDNWGRPQTVWSYNCGDKETTLSIDPKAAFQVATSKCDVCSALGVKTTAKIVEIYDNGKLTKDTDSYKATATKEMVGDQGQQIEYYAVEGGYRMVIVDTYLALVNKNVDAKFDTKDHVKSQAKLTLTVYGNDEIDDLTLNGTNGANFDYNVNDYVLVYVNKAEKQNSEVVKAVTASEVKYTGASLKNDELKLDGEWVKFACKYAVDETALDEFGSILVIYDLFGNVIGTFPVEVNKTLTVIDSMYAGTVKGDATFYADIVGTDAETTEDAVVDSLTYNDNGDKIKVKEISDRTDKNYKKYKQDADYGIYDKLYNYTADEDGVLTLTTVTNSITGTGAKTNITAKDRYLYYSVGTRDNKIAFNDETIFLVHEDDCTYTSTTGDKLEDLTAGKVEFITNKSGVYATVVYLYGGIERTTDTNLIYIPVQDVTKVETVKINGNTEYALKVNVVPAEGKEYTIDWPLTDAEYDTVKEVLSKYKAITVGGFFADAVYYKDTTILNRANSELDKTVYSIETASAVSAKTFKVSGSAVAYDKIANVYVIKDGVISAADWEDLSNGDYVHVFWTDSSKLYVADAMYIDKDLTAHMDDYDEYLADYTDAVTAAKEADDAAQAKLMAANHEVDVKQAEVDTLGTVAYNEQQVEIWQIRVDNLIKGVAEGTAAQTDLDEANEKLAAAEQKLADAKVAEAELTAAEAAAKLADDKADETAAALAEATKALNGYKADNTLYNPYLFNQPDFPWMNK